MLDKNNPLQQEMLTNGKTELEVCVWFRDSHKGMMNFVSDTGDEVTKEELAIFKRGNDWHKEMYNKYSKMVEKLNQEKAE